MLSHHAASIFLGLLRLELTQTERESVIFAIVNAEDFHLLAVGLGLERTMVVTVERTRGASCQGSYAEPSR